MKWDNRPRAVVPCAFMEEATDPILGTLQNTEISPLPYGVGVYVLDPQDGMEQPLPMYWVSPKVANARSIQSAWYVCADPNMTFTLRVSNVQTGHGATHIRGKAVDSTRKCGVEILVDGVNVGGLPRKYKMADPGKEREIRGFTIARNFDVGNHFGRKAVRVFRFLQAETVEEGKGAVESKETIGKIQLRQFCGTLRKAPLIAAAESCGDALTEAKPVEEKTAFKVGCSIAIDRCGSLIQERSSRDTYFIERNRQEANGNSNPWIGVVTLLVREKRWLETHKIIDEHGNAYREPPNPPEENRPSLFERRKRRKVQDTVDLTRPKKIIKDTIVIDD